MQEAWLAAWTGLPSFRGHSSVRTWLIRIVTTRALNALRRPRRTVPLDTVAEPATAGTEQEAELRERALAVRRAVAALPARQREAVVLRDLEGLFYDEVARALGCSVGAVKSALFRGRQALAADLEQYRPSAADGRTPSRTGGATGTATEGVAPGRAADPPQGGHP